MDNQAIRFFIHGSRSFCAAVEWCQGLVGESDKQKVHHFFDSPKQEIEKVNELVRRKKLASEEGEERRLRIEKRAWKALYKYVLSTTTIHCD